MFADCTLETTWAQRTRRSWSTLTSFTLEAAVVGTLLLLPLWKTVGLPPGRILPTPVSWGEPPAPAPHNLARHASATVVQSNLIDNVMIAPQRIPTTVARIMEAVPPPQLSLAGGIEGAIGNGARTGIWGMMNDSMARAAQPSVPAHSPAVRTFRESRLLEGSLIRRVQPTYPPLAKAARIQGPVVMFAIISKAGTIENLRTISGHPMLVPAAIDAVGQWRYRPYILNGEPVEVETQITVNFILN
jgi:protein TonB